MKYSSTLFLILSFLLATACSDKSADDKSGSADAKDAKGGDARERWSSGTSTPVRVTKVERGAIATYQVSTGNIEAEKIAPVYARVAEKVTEVSVDLGDIVKVGDPLATLYVERFQAELDKSDSALLRAQSRDKESQAEHDKLAEDYRLLTEGVGDTTDEGLFSKDEIRVAKFNLDKAAIALEIAKQEVVEAKANRALAKIDVDACVIRAPIAGVIARRMLEPHQLVARDSEVFTIAQLDSMRIKIDIPESVSKKLLGASKMSARPAVLMQTTAYPGKQFLGEVINVSPVIDPTKGMIQVVVSVVQAPEAVIFSANVDGVERTAAAFSTHTQGLLAQFPPAVRKGLEETLIEAARMPNMIRPGMWVQASVVTETKPDALVIPATALINGSVFVLDNAGASARPAGLGSKTGSETGSEAGAKSGRSERGGAKTDAAKTEAEKTSAKTEAKDAAKTGAPSGGKTSGGRGMGGGGQTARLVDISKFIGIQGEGFVEILSEGNDVLKEGMTIIWRGQEYLKDGGKVVIEEVAATSK